MLLRAPPLASVAQHFECRATQVYTLWSCIGVEQHQCSRALGIGGCVQGGHPASLLPSEHDGVRYASRIEHRPQVLHPRLQRRKLRPMIGQARAALVEQDQPKRAREPLIERTPTRRLPAVHEIRHEVRHIDEIDLALTHNLIRDRDTAVARVPDLLLHGVIFPHQRRPHQHPTAAIRRCRDR